MKMVNVREDLWYEIIDYSTDDMGNVVEVKAENGQWYVASEVKQVIMK